MKREPRGPYLRLRWYCHDGSVHPPQPYPCAERGGGIQHAEYSAARDQLAALGWHVGTIVAALTWDELWDAEHRQTRLRELPLERYLVDVDDGWVLRRARSYRGRIQAEDEEAKGRELLVRLLDQREWVAANFLARERASARSRTTGSQATARARCGGSRRPSPSGMPASSRCASRSTTSRAAKTSTRFAPGWHAVRPTRGCARTSTSCSSRWRKSTESVRARDSAPPQQRSSGPRAGWRWRICSRAGRRYLRASARRRTRACCRSSATPQ